MQDNCKDTPPVTQKPRGRTEREDTPTPHAAPAAKKGRHNTKRKKPPTSLSGSSEDEEAPTPSPPGTRKSTANLAAENTRLRQQLAQIKK
jgi:hypothetical protein